MWYSWIRRSRPGCWDGSPRAWKPAGWLAPEALIYAECAGPGGAAAAARGLDRRQDRARR